MHPEERARCRAIGALSRRRGKAKVACSTSSLPPDSPIAKWCVTRAVSGCAGDAGRDGRCFTAEPFPVLRRETVVMNVRTPRRSG